LLGRRRRCGRGGSAAGKICSIAAIRPRAGKPVFVGLAPGSAEMTFSMLYAFSENYVLLISHDEVVHGKGTLWGRMPGNDHVKAAGVRGLFAYQWAHPGKQLLFMGQEFGRRAEWSEERGVDWPFCRVMRPTKTTLGRLGSTPYCSSTSVSGSGAYCWASMPLWITRTLSGFTEG
jgi:hypothetical protein